MAVRTAPAYIGQSGYLHPVELDRNMIEAYVGERGGLFRQGDFAVTPTGVNQQTSVAAGAAALIGVENANQGAYFVYSDAAETKLFGTPSGSPRIDTLLLRVEDDQYGTISGSPEAYLDVVAGVPAGSPSARPDSDFNTGGSFYIPGAWFRLADVRINPGDTVIPSGQITHNLRYVRQAGRVLCTSTTRPSDPVAGDVVYEVDTGMERTYTGSSWRQSAPWIYRNTLVSNTAGFNITGIPSGLRTIRGNFSIRTTVAATNEAIIMRFNNDANTARYFYLGEQNLNATGGGYNNSLGTDRIQIGVMAGNTAQADLFGAGVFELVGWNNPHAKTPYVFFEGHMYESAATSFWHRGSATYFGSGPMTQLNILSQSGANFMPGSHIALEGWE